MKVFLDSNVIVDALVESGSSHNAAKLILALGEIGEFELWASPSQWTDVFYILTEGGKPSRRTEIKAKLQEVRKAVHVSMMGEPEIDAALASSWDDFEDAVVYQTARSVKPAVLITSNLEDYAQSEISVYSPEGFFAWLETEQNILYAEVEF